MRKALRKAGEEDFPRFRLPPEIFDGRFTGLFPLTLGHLRGSHFFFRPTALNPEASTAISKEGKRSRIINANTFQTI
jgi:hypothetical protein